MKLGHSLTLLLTPHFRASCTGGRPHKPLIGDIDFFPVLVDNTEKRVEAEAHMKSWSPDYSERRH
ncbi:hypothetical protein C7120_01170 [Prevotella sp. oral taxon 376]|uniref:hypothetical protein n=1 Tax=Prevotella sp. oral taxon 376 TaxID=712466 RepID=UPI000D1FBF39|nr:hypothetical protein [Prevotella sp. oral taxon 376]PTL33273.1 hypothetical protein C7120_01170 [Prevotella sp. oral taxon 376]